MRRLHRSFALLAVLLIVLASVVPAEDIPNTPYDESEGFAYEMAPSAAQQEAPHAQGNPSASSARSSGRLSESPDLLNMPRSCGTAQAESSPDPDLTFLAKVGLCLRC